jgi:HK97 family phage prohead protease
MYEYIETKLEIKSSDFKQRTFDAVAAGIGNVDNGKDKFIKGAFKRSIDGMVKAGKVKFLDAHPYKYPGVPSTKFVLGKVIAAYETDTELVVRIYVSDTQDGNDLLTKIQEGVVNALSVGYLPVRQHFEKEEDEVIRILEEVKLMEVSAVIWGMNDRSTIDALSVKEREELERMNAKALTMEATLYEETAEDALWKSNQAFNSTLRDIIGDESVEDKRPLLQKALEDYKGLLSKLLGLDTAKLTEDREFATIRANEPLIALLEGKQALSEKEEKDPPKADPPDAERTRSGEDVEALKSRVTSLRLKQVE